MKQSYESIFKEFRKWIKESRSESVLYHRIPEDYLLTVLTEQQLYTQDMNENIARMYDTHNRFDINEPRDVEWIKQNERVGYELIQLAKKGVNFISFSTMPDVDSYWGHKPLIVFRENVFREHYKMLPIDVQKIFYPNHLNKVAKDDYDYVYDDDRDLKEIRLLTKKKFVPISPLSKYIIDIVISKPEQELKPENNNKSKIPPPKTTSDEGYGSRNNNNDNNNPYLMEEITPFSSDQLAQLCKENGIGLVMIPQKDFIKYSKMELSWSKFRVY